MRQLTCPVIAMYWRGADHPIPVESIPAGTLHDDEGHIGGGAVILRVSRSVVQSTDRMETPARKGTVVSCLPIPAASNRPPTRHSRTCVFAGTTHA